LLAASAFAWGASTAAEAPWRVTRSTHFEIYTQADDGQAHVAAARFERLWTFFEQSGLSSNNAAPVRVIAFRSRGEFDSYKPRAGAAAFYAGTERRDYLVLPGLQSARFVAAAHEYTHARIHASGLKLPPWLSEGLADFFSTVRISERESDLGGELPARIDVLRHNRWMPISELLASPGPSAQLQLSGTALFYAQSWALTEMLALSEGYQSKFWELVNRLSAGSASAGELQRTYSKPLSQIEEDLRRWVEGGRYKQLRLPGVSSGPISTTSQAISTQQADLLLADLCEATGELDRAKKLYEDLLREAPSNAEAWAALGAIALREGKAVEARSDWGRAVADGLKDARVCYRYAQLEDEAGASAEELRPLLLRAVELDPGFDDARYKLALLESNAGRFEAALVQLQAMRRATGARAYGYWMASAYALEELGRREEGKRAAAKALENASSPDERVRGAQLSYLCDTDLGVQFARDAKGQLQMETVRVPHGATNRNPFIEAGDRMMRVEGRLIEIRCESGKATGITVSTPEGALKISITDPAQVAMRNAPAEFNCGPQAGPTVIVDYAASPKPDATAAGAARGIEFR